MVDAPLCNSLYLFLYFLCHPYILAIFVEIFIISIIHYYVQWLCPTFVWVIMYGMVQLHDSSTEAKNQVEQTAINEIWTAAEYDLNL